MHFDSSDDMLHWLSGVVEAASLTWLFICDVTDFEMEGLRWPGFCSICQIYGVSMAAATQSPSAFSFTGSFDLTSVFQISYDI